jgi:hypothetical protein
VYDPVILSIGDTIDFPAHYQHRYHCNKSTEAIAIHYLQYVTPVIIDQVKSLLRIIAKERN